MKKDCRDQSNHYLFAIINEEMTNEHK